MFDNSPLEDFGDCKRDATVKIYRYLANTIYYSYIETTKHIR